MFARVEDMIEAEDVVHEAVRQLFWVRKENEILRRDKTDTLRDTAKIVDSLETLLDVLIRLQSHLLDSDKAQVDEVLNRVHQLSENLADMKHKFQNPTKTTKHWGKKATIKN